jgi:predicted deacylase
MIQRPRLVLLIWLAAGSLLCGADDAVPFNLAGHTVEPGTSASFMLPVPPGDDGDTALPVTILHGRAKGPVLALTAGVHGYEYPPILALYRLKESLDPAALRGTIIMVHIANLPAFQKRIIYYNPWDWKNLNRVFPGDAGGSVTQRIAWTLTENVIKRCNALIDLHCGDGNEALIPYTYWMVSGNEAVDERSKQMALAFNIHHIIIDETRQQVLAESRYLANTAIILGKPAITTESGFLGGTDELSIKRNEEGVENVLRSLGMLAGPLRPADNTVWIDRYEVIYSEHDGLFHPETEMGYYVREGERVGRITDYFGKTIQELRAPFTGILLYIVGTPPVMAGEPLFEVGRVKK